MSDLPEVSAAVFVEIGKKKRRRIAAVISLRFCNFYCSEILAVDTLLKAEEFLQAELKKAGLILDTDNE